MTGLVEAARQLMEVIGRIQDAINARYMRMILPHKLTVTQFKLLQHLYWHPEGLSVGELSGHLGLTNSAVSGIADRLEKEGWVERSRMGELRAGEEEGILRDLGRALSLDVDSEIGSYPRCKLTRGGFGKRLENLFAEEEFTLNTLKLLDFKMYYKRSPDVKIVLALEEDEKRTLQTYFLPQDLRVYLPTHPGPMTLVRTDWGSKSAEEVEEIIDLAARITATHSEAVQSSIVPVSYRFENDDETQQVNVPPFRSAREISTRCFSARLTSLLSGDLAAVVEKPAQ